MRDQDAPFVSVIIPAYGRPAFLGDALRSVLRQGYQALEVVVVDDASPEPVEIVDDERIRVVRAAENGGPAAARNLGVEHARGQLLLFLDDDDTWTPERLALALEGLQRAPIAICWQDATQGRELEGAVHDRILDAMTPPLGATAVWRDAWQPMDASYRACEDLEWWLRITATHEVATVARQGLVVRQHTGERVGYGTRVRIDHSRRLLNDHASYFRRHPRAAAFRWKRIGLMHMALGEGSAARGALLRSIARRPQLASFWHLARTLRLRDQAAKRRESRIV